MYMPSQSASTSLVTIVHTPHSSRCSSFRLGLVRRACVGLILRTLRQLFGRLVRRRGQSALTHLAHEDLALVHADVGLRNDRYQLVSLAAGDLAREAKVDWHSDLVHLLALYCEGVQARGHHGASLYLAARAAYHHPVAVLHTALPGELRA